MVRSRKSRKRKHLQRRRAGYELVPLTALILFLAFAFLIRSDAGSALENSLISAAGSDPLACSLFRLMLPARTEDAVSVPDEPAAAEPEAPPSPLNASLPDSEVYESAPVLPAAVPIPAPLLPDEGSVREITIDGESDGCAGAGSVYLRNETSYNIDVSELLRRESKVKLSGDGVQVLIIHTHGTEAYTPDKDNQYVPSDPDRTTDSNYNVLRVGDEIERILSENGIKTVHSYTLNDYPAYSGSYNRALEDIKKHVKENPSVKVVIDVHRDAMVTSAGVKYKAVADINGQRAAQLMFVTGTDEGGLSHDGWRDNLSFQLKLHSRLNTLYPGIMRPINIRRGRFNQHVCPGSMLLEVGTSGNTLPEALYSAQLFAGELAAILLEN